MSENWKFYYRLIFKNFFSKNRLFIIINDLATSFNKTRRFFNITENDESRLLKQKRTINYRTYLIILKTRQRNTQKKNKTRNVKNRRAYMMIDNLFKIYEVMNKLKRKFKSMNLHVNRSQVKVTFKFLIKKFSVIFILNYMSSSIINLMIITTL